MIVVSQDAEGLKTAAMELLEEEFERPNREALERVAAQSADPEAVLRGAPAPRTLSPGYYMFLGYVVEAIEQPLEAGVTFTIAELDSGELLALRALKEARAEFRRKHPPCGRCGRLLGSEFDSLCPECQVKS